MLAIGVLGFDFGDRSNELSAELTVATQADSIAGLGTEPTVATTTTASTVGAAANPETEETRVEQDPPAVPAPSTTTSTAIPETIADTEPEAVVLTSLEPVEGKYFRDRGNFFVGNGTLLGEDTGQILIATVSWGSANDSAEIAYNLSEQYATLRIRIAYSPSSDADTPLVVTATIDNRAPLFSRSYSLFDDLEQTTEYDVTGGRRLTLTVENQTGGLCRGPDVGCELYFLVAEIVPSS